MGLTIGYEISFKGNAEELNKKLLKIKNKCLDLPFQEVYEVEHTVYSKEDMDFYRQQQHECRFPNNTSKNLAARDKALADKGLNLWTCIVIDIYQKRKSRYEFMKFEVWPGEGCESASFEFFKKRTYWRCKGSCKTQYAISFIRCHTLIIKLLDMFKQEGFIIKVRDEGEYWKTRSLKVLAQNINSYTGLLQSVSKFLSTAFKGTDDSIESLIDKSANIIKIDDNRPEK